MKIALCGCFLLCSGLLPAFRLHAEPLPSVADALNAIGTWDGVTETAELEGDYEDRLQQEIPFGRRSYYLTPWRSYMDTWPLERLADMPGVVLTGQDEDLPAITKLLAESGFRHARMEIGWGTMEYDDPPRLIESFADGFRRKLLALKAAGIRPLVLLNANSSSPVPIKRIKVWFQEQPVAGAGEIVVKNPAAVVPGYSGITTFHSGLTGKQSRNAFPLITHVDKKSGRCTLSAPLPKTIEADAIPLFVLKFHPFSGEMFEDGTPNPLARETLEGWRTYVGVVTTFVKQTLGTDGQPDAGFDLEVWNEFSFGSHFLDERHYYDPPRRFSQPLTYSNHGRESHGAEVILPLTVDFVNDPANGLPGVRVVSGFSNQRPFDSGTDMWPGQAGLSKHYYTQMHAFGNAADPEHGTFCRQTENNLNSGPLNALGLPDGKPDEKDWHTVEPGSFFIPTLRRSMPEFTFYGYNSEHLVRDLQPFPGPFARHHRYAHPGNGNTPTIWQTEVNHYRYFWAQELLERIDSDDPRYRQLLHAVAAKALLRSMVMMNHKGIDRIYVYAAAHEDDKFAVLPEAFTDALATAGHQLTDEVRAEAGPQVQVIGRLAKIAALGKPIGVARRLRVKRLVEHKPQLVFQGDGTAEHPDRFHRHDFACLPYQIDERSFVVAYYIVTRNIVHEWSTDRDLLDPERYRMPDQTFDLTLSNVRGHDATVSCYDPMTNDPVPVSIIASSDMSLTLRVPTTDYPRFIRIIESKPGPLISDVNVWDEGDRTEVTFRTNQRVAAELSWGAIPDRSADGQQALAENDQFRVSLPPLEANSGISIRVQLNGLTHRWPQWGHDTRGMLRWTPVDHTPDVRLAMQEAYLPVLPSQQPVDGIDLTLPSHLAWQDNGAEKSVSIGKPPDVVEIHLSTEHATRAEFAERLPAIASGDRRLIERIDRGGRSGWQVEYHLNAASHPDDALLSKLFLIWPQDDERLIVLRIEATYKARKRHQETIDGLLDSVSF